MSRYLKNRCSKEIIAFLEAHGFCCGNTVGDDEIYYKKDWKFTCKVTLNKKSTPIRTMQSIKKCSGYFSKEWTNWWRDNGFGE